MAEISQADIERAIKTTCATVLRNEHYFADLDGLAGDGDFGTSLATGFRQIEKEWDEIPKTDIGAMLLKISMIVSKHVGGSSGPIWGTGFMKAAMLTRGKSEIALQDLAQMLGSAIEGIQARGGAQLGDKTLLDALIPVHEKLTAQAAGGDKAAALKDAAEAADNAVDETRHLVAHRGRASQVGERSANTPDPGIVAIATILQDWCKDCGVERTPTAPEVVKATA
jgi:dihydroxyacetone kinase phosphoprotein-dependent L subunit|uniref:dihydroxyacetone kinase subunit DhaL n=1 Tax=Altererythrobacter segetis TaxID=1104773 RepID=UPI00140A8A6D|nr:dihydroxyacetone kinase subunit DhaL [Altererythrobacter segetis]